MPRSSKGSSEQRGAKGAQTTRSKTAGRGKRTSAGARSPGALESSPAELHDLYNNAPCGYHSLDSNGTFVRINDTELEWLGCERDAVLGKRKFVDFVSEKSRATFATNFESFKERGWLKDVEFELIRGDGSLMQVLATATAIYDAAGAYVMSRTTLYDITERKRVEASLRRTERQLTTLMDQYPDFLARFDAEGRHIYVSPSLARALGVDPEALLGKTHRDVELPGVRRRNEAAHATVEAVLRGGDSGGFESTWQTPEGERVIETRVFPERDETGQVSGAIAIGRDITVRRRAQEALRESERRYHDIFENVLDGVYLLELSGDGHFRNLEINRAFERSTGLRREDLIGKVIEETVPQATAEIANKKYRHCVEAGEPIEETATLDLPTGRRHYVSTLIPVADADGRTHRIIGISRDVTATKRNEEINAARLHLLQFAVGHSVDELLEETLNQAEKLSDSRVGFYHFVRDDQETLVLQNWSTRTKGEFCRAEGQGLHYPISQAGVWVDCVKARRPVIHNDYAALSHRRGMPEGHAEVVRELVVPVVRGEKICAILGVGNKPTDYDESDVETVALLADLAWEVAERKLVEDRMRLLDFALNNVRDEAFLIDETAHFTYVNDEACRALDYSRDALLELDVAGVDPDFPIERWPEHWDEIRRRGSLTFEGRHRRRDGSIYPVEISANYFEFGGRGYNLALARDISERKRDVATLHRLNREMRAISSCNETLLRATDETALLDDICRIICDEAGYRMAWVGFAENDADKTIRPAAWAGVESGYIADAKLSWSEASERGRGPGGVVVRSGEVVVIQDFATDPRMAPWLEGARARGYQSGVFLPLRDEHARVFGVLLIYAAEANAITSQDVTLLEELAGDLAYGIMTLRARAARDAALESLREREAFISTILDSVDEGFIVVDRSYRILAGNRAFYALAESPAEAAEGKACYEVAHRRDRPCFETGVDCPVRRTFETGAAHVTSHTHLDGSGAVRYVELKSYPITDASGEIISAIETVNDVTENRRLEEQLIQAQKMEAIGTLAGGVAHDFNNILTAIIGYASLVSMKMAPDDPSRTSLDQVLASANRAAQLTQGLLAFSRKQVNDPRPVDLNDVVRGVDALLRRLIGEDVVLSTRLCTSKLVALADAGQIGQVLMNLATNARDAMPRGGALSIRTDEVALDDDDLAQHGLSRAGRYAVLSVADTGSGIEEATREKIFDPFFTTKEPGRGTGLGLAIVYGIVKQHGGDIEVTSEMGKGTVFKLLLPLVTEAVTEVVSETPRAPRGAGETILLAEDDGDVRRLTRTILTDFGYRVIEAFDGADAVAKVRANIDAIDLLVLDVIMPKMSGREVYDAAKALRADVPVLFLSGYTADILDRQGLAAEGITRVTKPVTPSELLHAVRDVLAHPRRPD